MPQTTHKLQVVIEAENRANAAFNGVRQNLDTMKTKLQKMQPAFQKMALFGGAAFAGIAVGVKGAISQVAIAEGAYNKFNTVFGEHSDDMLNFVNDIRKEMPTATSEIVRMAADLQDLMVPLGLSRELAADMSKGFLDVSNKIAAFNDVDPTQVLEAIKSGLSGSSEPLRRYGVNALETSLEARALKEGLLETGQAFKDLDPEVKTQIRAQALLAQIIDNSSDAIEGFEENNDSFIRRQQELNATILETKERIGTLLLPMFDQLLKKLLPIIEKIAAWIEKHPELTKNIILVAAALTGLIAGIGLLGMVLPAIITGVSLLAGPFGIVAAAIVALGIILSKAQIDWGNFMQSIEEKTGLISMLTELWEDLNDLWVSQVLPALKDLWDSMTPLLPVLEFLAKAIGVVLLGAIYAAITAIRIIASLLSLVITAGAALSSAVTDFWVSSFQKFGDIVNWVVEKIQALIDAIKRLNVVQGARNAISSVAGTVGGWFGRAAGGAVQAGRTMLVGEHGPELFTPASHGRVMAGLGGGASLNITITGNNFVGEEGIAEQIGNDIMKVVKSNIRL